MIARILLGLIFFVFGLNGFLQFIQPPGEPPEALKAFMTGMMATGYFIPFLKGTETLMGALLLANRFVPLALTVLAPIIVNIFLIHAILEPSGLVMAAVIVLLEIFLAWSYRGHFAGVLVAKAKVTSAEVLGDGVARPVPES